MHWITTRRYPGWLALTLHDDHVDLVHVRRATNGRPQVALCDSYRKEGSEASTLARLSSELRLKRYRCTTVLGRDQYQLHQVEAPNVPEPEIKSAVRWRVKDIIDYPVESAAIDVFTIPADPEAPAPEHMLYAVTAPNAAVAKCVKPFNDSGLTLDVIDIPELAQRNVAALFEPPGQGVAMLAFYDDESILTFTRAGELYSARRIDVTFAQLAEGNDERRRTYFERIALELQRSLDHLERHYHYVPVVKLLLGPMGADIALAQYLKSVINAPIESIDLAKVMDMAAVPELKTAAIQARYLRTVGAALRDQEALA